MIEVEKKFRPTEEQLKNLVAGAEFLGEKIVHDVYYDYPDLRLFKQEVRLRNRNGSYELKIGDDEGVGVAEEIEEEAAIMAYLKTELPLLDFIKENLTEIINYKQTRNKYKKGDFTIDVDVIDFGYSCVEIELMVKEESEIAGAQRKIFELATSFGIEIQDVPSKRNEYLKLRNPEVYKILYSSN